MTKDYIAFKDNKTKVNIKILSNIETRQLLKDALLKLIEPYKDVAY